MARGVYEFRVLKDGINDTSEADIGRNILYKCLCCNVMIPSTPKDDTACDCGNIYIDFLRHVLVVRDKKKIQILEKAKKAVS